jgi:hypothetical protein
MRVLNWATPPKVMSRRDYESISADGAPPGVYTPNMSDADAATWRAKLIGGKDPRVEIRVLRGSQMLIVVRPDRVRISMNGPTELDMDDGGWEQFIQAVAEAREVLSTGEVP